MRFKNAMFGGIAACLIGLTGTTAIAQTAQASGQYGYSGPTPSPQGGPSYTCQPDNCQLPMVGCHVWVCPCPCDGKDLCKDIQSKLPLIKPEPTCQEVPICYIDSDLPPKKEKTIHIDRNCYLPVRVHVKYIPHDNITAVNFQVRWREVHVLCDDKGNPIPPDKASAILKELDHQLASNPLGGAGNAPATPSAPSSPASEAAPPMTFIPPVPAPTSAAAPSQAPATQPTTTAATPAMPQKQWVWLAQEGLYGYGYQRADGLWEIDPGSRRATF